MSDPLKRGRGRPEGSKTSLAKQRMRKLKDLMGILEPAVAKSIQRATEYIDIPIGNQISAKDHLSAIKLTIDTYLKIANETFEDVEDDSSYFQNKSVSDNVKAGGARLSLAVSKQ